MKKDAQKFIVRFYEANDPLHLAAKKAAEDNHISLNSFILQAIEEKLGRGKAMDKVIEAAQEALRLQSLSVLYIEKP